MASERKEGSGSAFSGVAFTFQKKSSRPKLTGTNRRVEDIQGKEKDYVVSVEGSDIQRYQLRSSCWDYC